MNFMPQAQLSGPGRFMPTRGRIQNGAMNGLSYPSPFFDIAHTYLPANFKQLFRYCRYYFLTNPVINAIVFKLAEYPITDVVIEHDNSDVRARWTEYLQDHLSFRAFQLEVGLDYFVYGNAFISVVNPFTKYLICSACKSHHVAAQIMDKWTFTGNEFRLTCPRCSRVTNASAVDRAIKDPSGVRLLRWNPEDIEVQHSAIKGTTRYFYTLPQIIRSDITLGRKEALVDIPQIFIEAVKQQKGIRLTPGKIFHLRRPSIAGPEQGWGIPLLLPLLKDAFYLQIMKKAQETLLVEAILPMRTIFPQPSTGTSDPYTNINLADWRDHISLEIARWRIDPNYYPILPLPIGTQTLGGDGKALLMGNEMQMLIDQLIWGAGCPREFVTGGMSYSGSQVSMRMLENSFAGYILHHKALLRWIIEQVTGFLDHWQPVKGRFKPFKMADDMQRMAFLFQLSQANKISDRTLLTATDLDVDNENKLMDSETEGRVIATKKQQLASAQIQAEVQGVMMRSQAKLQQEMQAAAAAPPAPGAPGGPEPSLMQGGGVPGGTDASAPGGMGPGMMQGAGMGGTALMAGPGMAPPAVPSSYGQQLDQVISSGLRADRRLAEGTAGLDLGAYAAMMARHIVSSDPQSAQALMASLQGQPELYAMVVQNVQQLRSTGAAGASDGAGQPSIDMRPLPAQRPPRRDQAPV